jgi:hypothetical protein
MRACRSLPSICFPLRNTSLLESAAAVAGTTDHFDVSRILKTWKRQRKTARPAATDFRLKTLNLEPPRGEDLGMKNFPALTSGIGVAAHKAQELKFDPQHSTLDAPMTV